MAQQANLDLLLYTLILSIVFLMANGLVVWIMVKRYQGDVQRYIQKLASQLEPQAGVKNAAPKPNSNKNLEDKLEHEVDQIAAELRKQLLSEIKGLTDRWDDQMTQMNLAAIAQVKTKQDEIEKSMNAIRDARISEMEEKIRMVVTRVSREIIGQELTAKQHEELVSKAIKKAKDEHLL